MRRHFSVGLLLIIGLVTVRGVPVRAQAPPSEPPAAAASPAVQAILDEAAELGREKKTGEAFSALDRALTLARSGMDAVGQAQAHRARAVLFEASGARSDALAAWLASDSASDTAGDGPGRVTAHCRMALLTLDQALRGQLATHAIELLQSERLRSRLCARALHSAARTATVRGQLDLARQWCSGALLRRQSLVPDSPDEAESWHLAGYLAQIGGNAKSARESYLRALAIRERDAPGSALLADALDNLQILEGGEHDLSAAVAYGLRALAIRERLASTDGDIAPTLRHLGGNLLLQGNVESAERYLLRAVAIEERLEGDTLTLAECLNNLGVAARRQGRAAQALEYCERALAIRQKRAPGSSLVADTLHNLGSVAVDLSSAEDARTYFQAALTIRERVAPRSLGIASELAALGGVAIDLGEMEMARRYYQQALAIRERLAPTSLPVADALHGLASVAYRQGDLDASEQYNARAIVLRESLAPGSSQMADSLLNVGLLAWEQGDGFRAGQMIRRSLAIRQVVAPDSREVGQALVALGLVAYAGGDLLGAREFFSRARENLERAAPGSIDLASCISNLGSVARARSDLELAEKHFRHASKLFAAEAPGSLDEARSLGNLGLIAQDKGDLPRALGFARRAWSIVTQQRGALQGEPGFIAFEARHFSFASSLVGLLLRTHRTQEALQVLESARAKALLQLLVARGVTRELVPQSLWREYSAAQRTRERLEVAVRQAVGTDPTSQRVELLSAQSREQSLWAEMVKVVRKTHPEVFPPELTAEQARRALPADTLFLAFSVGERENTLFLVRKRGPVRAYQVPVGGAALDARVAALRAAITGQPDPLRKVREEAALLEAARGAMPGSKMTRATRVFVRKAGGDPMVLGRELWQGLLPAAAQTEILKAKRLVISPDGPLWDLPFGALVTNASGAPRYLGLQQPISYAQSLTLAGMATTPERRTGQVPPRGALVIANPRFTPTGPTGPASQTGPTSPIRTTAPTDLRTRLVRDGQTLPPLPGAGREGVAVAALYGSASHTGAEPTEAWFRKNAPAARIIHLATHGFFNSIDALGSKVLLAPGPKPNPEAEPNFKNDGSLTAKEITEELRIRAQLVVLSACETGIGR